MIDEGRIALSKLRLENAKERLRFIPGIIELGDYKTAANRSYYAVFFAMRAVLALDGFDSKKHSGVIAEFRRRYVKTGVFDPEICKDSLEDGLTADDWRYVKRNLAGNNPYLLKCVTRIKELSVA